jgi:hypothetical protein
MTGSAEHRVMQTVTNATASTPPHRTPPTADQTSTAPVRTVTDRMH